MVFNRRGFTLVELGVVFFILAVICAISLSGFVHLRQRNIIRIQQNNIEENLLLARNTAKQQAQSVDIIFLDNGYVIQSSRGVLKEVTLPQPFTVSALRLGFNAEGNPRFSGTLFLYRGGKTVARMTVAVGSGIITWTKQ
jgi:type II secretory pathway pseudopilin PulG